MKEEDKNKVDVQMDVIRDDEPIEIKLMEEVIFNILRKKREDQELMNQIQPFI